MFEWHKKEKPVFTGITRGIGGFGFGAGGEEEASGPITASGGTKSPTSRSGYIVHTFQHPDTSSFTPDTSQTFEVTSGLADIEILCVGGGGGGAHLGGGGGGGLIYKTGITIGPGTYPITVGAGGEHGTWGTAKQTGSPGGLSRVHGLPIPGAAYGGGGGAQGSNTAPDPSAGLPGGAGGGGNAADGPFQGGGLGLNPSNPSIFPSFPLYEPGDTQGYNGAPGSPSSDLVGGGGGGSGSAGGTPPNGQGGNGTSNSITGSAVVYSGGGGGGSYGSNPGADRPQSAPTSGNGGAGVIAHYPTNPGTAHRGGGGGGAGSTPTQGSPYGGGHGGPGIVIIAYEAP